MSAAKVSPSEVSSFVPPHFSSESKMRGHSVQFYLQESSLLDELSKFIGPALAAGDAVIVIATSQHREGLGSRLAAHGLNLARIGQQGRYISLDAGDTLSEFLVKGHPDPELFSALIGDVLSRVRTAVGKDKRIVAYGEMVALLWEEGQSEAAIELEQLWNRLGESHEFLLRCSYPIAGFQQQEHAVPFSRICKAHSEVIPADSYTDLATDHEKFRDIARLQQKEQVYETLIKTKEALETEIAEKVEIERKLRQSERYLRDLSGRLFRIQEEERQHLGRELHDSIGQYLASLKIDLELMSPELEQARVGQQLGRCIRLVDQAISEVRTMSYLLYPPMLEEMGLGTAIPWFLDGFATRSGIQTTAEIAGGLGRMPRPVESAVFRVLQESMTNVLRHSGSPTAHISLSIHDGNLRLEVRDRGKGIPAEILKSASDALGSQGVGLRGMAERMRQLGGNLELASDESGTTVIAVVPCEAALQAKKQ